MRYIVDPQNMRVVAADGTTIYFRELAVMLAAMKSQRSKGDENTRMNMIQLQHIDEKGYNHGGLYVRLSEIAAVYAVYSQGPRPEAHIVLKSGRDFRTAQTVSELLDLLMSRTRGHDDKVKEVEYDAWLNDPNDEPNGRVLVATEED